jgi:hypothetical protein
MVSKSLALTCAATIALGAEVAEAAHSWKRRTSSAVAVSGERFKNAANRLQLWIWLRCEWGPSLRAVMSSIMR